MEMNDLQYAINVLEGLRLIQHREYGYLQFIKVLKRRLRLYTGRTEVMFYDELQIVRMLGELGVLQEVSGLKPIAKPKWK
jgi:hypothetical protein